MIFRVIMDHIFGPASNIFRELDRLYFRLWVTTLAQRLTPSPMSVSVKAWYKMRFQALHKTILIWTQNLARFFLCNYLVFYDTLSQWNHSRYVWLLGNLNWGDLTWPEANHKKRCINIPGYNEKLLLKASNWFHLKHSTDEKMRYTTVRKSFTPDHTQTILGP